MIRNLFSKMSLRTKISSIILPTVMCCLLLLSFTSYYYIVNVIEQELADSMLNSVGKSAESINRWLETIMIEPESIASTPDAKNINNDFKKFDALNINRHKMLHTRYSDIFQDIYAANKKGVYHTVQYSQNEYSIFIGDIANRPYFLSIMAGGPTQITPPLISRTTGIPTIFIVAPIKDDDNQPQGLIGAGISLKYIQEIARALKAGKTGYGFIIARDGSYIHHPNSDLIMQAKITDHPSPSEKQLGMLMIGGKFGVYRYTFNETKMVAFYQPVPISGWSVATVLPESELLAPAIRMMRILVVITCISVIFTGCIIMFVMRRLFLPLQTLATRTKEIARGNMDGEAIDVTSTDEIGILSQSFNTMTENLKRTLEGLKKSEDNYRSIYENAIEGIMLTKFDGTIVAANPAMANILGYDSAPELIKVHPQATSFYVNPDERNELLALLLEKRVVRNYEMQIYNRDGDTIWISISCFLVLDADDTPDKIESLVTDITERKQAEKEKEELSKQLAQANKLEAVGKLAGGVAHDFNNMLFVILGHTELALLKINPKDPLYKTFKDIQNAAVHSSNLTKQLLAFARKQTSVPVVVDLNLVIENTLSLLRRLITENIRLNVTSGEAVWPIYIDPDQISQILTNLCVNARDAISGVGRIDIETHNISFDEEYCDRNIDFLPGDYVCLVVSDNGCGMDEEIRQHIFDPFFSTKEIYEGTGLGLATVYGIIKQNKGFINIYSEPGLGTTFRIYFPRYSGGKDDLKNLQDSRLEPLKPMNILLVEDDVQLLNVCKEILEGLNCRVTAINSPTEAVSYIKNETDNIDLLLTDVVMPEMTGKELASHITVVKPNIKVLFMSGYTADVIAHKGVLEAGINFIHKPFSSQSIADKIREVMNQ